MHLDSRSLREPSIERLVVRLARVRRGIAARLWVEGLMRVLWLLIALAAADLALDWFFRMDRAQRTVMLGLVVMLIGWNAYRWLVRPLATSASDDALALQLEMANPSLNQTLITSLQLSRLDSRRRAGMSPVLVQLAIATGAKIADEASFNNILDSRRFARNAILLFAAALCVFALALAVPFAPSLKIWLSRNLLLSTATWPQKTYLMIERLGEDGTVAFPRETDWTQIVSISLQSAFIPDAVDLDFRGAGKSGSRRSVAMQRTSDRRFETTFVGVTEPFEFRARGGDAVTEWTRAVPVDPPALRELAIFAIPPAYTGQSSEELQPGQSPYQVLRGSSLSIVATANKPLATAEWIHGETHWPLIASDSHGKQLAGSIPASDLAAGNYSIHLVDTLGLTGSAAEFGLQWRPDRAPQVWARLVGIGGTILPQAQIPLACQVMDDFGLASFAIVARWNREASEGSDEQHVLPLSNPPQLGQVGEPANHRELTVNDTIDLTPLKLVAGTNVVLRFEAADNDNISGPNIGRSSDFVLRVVTESEFRSDLLRREKMERQELESLLKVQDELLTDSRVLAAAISSSSALTAEQKELLPKIYRGQKVVGQKLAAIADRVANLADEVRNNRLPDAGGRLQNRLANQIATPLKSVATQSVPSVILALDQARQAEMANRSVVLTEIIAYQSDISARMKQVLEQMTSSEGFQEAIDLLYEIQKAQGEVYEQTNKAREERIKRILEGPQ